VPRVTTPPIPPPPDDKRFVMDYSLFRVAKQLRMLGYDVKCDPTVQKEQILHLAQRENRIVVTGSTHLLPMLQRVNRHASNNAPTTTHAPPQQRKRVVIGYTSDGESEYGSDNDDAHDLCDAPIRFVQVKSMDTYGESIRRIAQAVGLTWDTKRVFSRCVGCNSLIEAATKAEVASAVHTAVLRIYQQFYKCQGCGKVYWGVDNGTIVNYKALRTLEQLKRLCCPGSGGEVSEELQRHLMSFPRVVKAAIFSFLPASDLRSVEIVFPALVDLIASVERGNVMKFPKGQ